MVTMTALRFGVLMLSYLGAGYVMAIVKHLDDIFETEE